MKKNNKRRFLAVFATVLLLTILITASFAYFGMFTVNLENKVAVNIHANNIGNTSFIETSANLNVIVPTSGMFKGNTGLAAENTATLTVNLTGAKDVLTTCTYDVVYEYDLSSEIYGSTVAVTSGATKEITMQVDSPSGTNNYASETNFAYDSSWTPKTTTVGAKKTLVRGATITSEGTSVVQNINITGRYYNLEVDQAQLGNKSFTGKIYVENNNCTVGEQPKAKDIILAKNGGIDNITELPDSAFESVTTANDKGMYKKADDLGTSYYFRGAVDNNWVKFGKEGDKDIYWRIIRINGDGSIRMIYSGTTAPTESTKVVMTGTGTQITVDNTNTFKFNSSYNNPSYVGYMFTEGQQHGNGTPSTIKTAIDNWYKTTTLETDATTKELVSQDQIFCNDRSVTTSESGTPGEISGSMSTSTTYYYGAYVRLITKKSPQLKCPTESDKFTSRKSSIGNKALTYPVGLITADEVAMAGGKFETSNSTYYLYTNQYYWSGSPADFFGDRFGASGFNVDSSGDLYNYYVDYSTDRGARPVVSLSSKAKLLGNGTYSNPYTVSS